MSSVARSENSIGRADVSRARVGPVDAHAPSGRLGDSLAPTAVTPPNPSLEPMSPGPTLLESTASSPIAFGGDVDEAGNIKGSRGEASPGGDEPVGRGESRPRPQEEP